jgi:hypothetical protein
MNTKVQEDIDYLHKLEKENDWIVCIECDVPVNGNSSIGSFIKNATDEDAIYIRLDDDVVYLEPNFIKELKEIRTMNEEPLIIYPNIINNAIISNLHYRNNLIKYKSIPKYYVMDNIGWNDSEFALKLHAQFLNDLIIEKDINKWKSSYTKWMLYDFERVSINCICWFGKDMKDVVIIGDEEDYLSSILPRMRNRPAMIVNSPICAHFSFFTQRELLDKSGILEMYNTISDCCVGGRAPHIPLS